MALAGMSYGLRFGNTIAGFAVVPTTGDLVSCTVASTTCTLADSLFKISGPTASRTYTFPDANATITRTIANGTIALNTTTINTGACSAAQTGSATGTLTTDNVLVDFNADPTGTTGYAPVTTGMLTIIKYPTADTVNVKVCNLTASNITPGATVTLNFRVVR